ncbi:hypothetical protein A2U01_0073192, partial [Trifolium medium]|nr:hypothetical protein [Trifolium medium]
LLTDSESCENCDGEERKRKRNCEGVATGVGSGTCEHRGASWWSPAGGEEKWWRRVARRWGSEGWECEGVSSVKNWIRDEK